MSTTTKEKIAVMQAYEDGKTIQFRHRTSDPAAKWHDILRPIIPDWAWPRTDYRVKPEPKVIYVNFYDEGMSWEAFDKEQDAKHDVQRRLPYARDLRVSRGPVEFIEVIKE